MRQTLRKPLNVAAIVVGLSLGTYGIASAASGSSSASNTTAATIAAGPSGPAGGTAETPWGNQRSDETPLTGDALARVRTAALAKVGANATVVRVETDADGHAAYEAHILKSDGTPETVYVDGSYAVVSVESR